MKYIRPRQNPSKVLVRAGGYGSHWVTVSQANVMHGGALWGMALGSMGGLIGFFLFSSWIGFVFGFATLMPFGMVYGYIKADKKQKSNELNATRKERERVCQGSTTSPADGIRDGSAGTGGDIA